MKEKKPRRVPRMAYVEDSLYQSARANGMNNFSSVVRSALMGYG